MKIDLGKKRVCEDCGNKFYDLGEKQPACTKCGHISLSASLEEQMELADSRAIDELIQQRADERAKNEMRFIRADAVEDIDEVAVLHDEILEEDHQHFDMESDGDASDYMEMNVRNASLVDEIDDGSDDYEERLER